MGSSSQRPGRLPVHLLRAFAALLFVFYAMQILLHPRPPFLGDMGNWAYSGMLFARHLHGQPDTFHVLKHYPVPNSTLTVLIGLFAAVVPWALAVKLFLVFYLALAFSSIAYLARASQASPLIWLIAPAGFFLNVNFWYGFLAFQLGIAFLFFFIGLLLQREQGRANDVLVGIVLLLLFFTHMVPFTFACLALVFFALQTGRYRILYQLVLPVLLLVGYIAGRAGDGKVEGAVANTVSPHLLSVMFWAYKANTFLKSFGLVNPVASDGRTSAALLVEGHTLFIALFAINLIACVALLVVFLRGIALPAALRRAPFLWLAAAVSLPVYLIAPRSLLGISDPGSRILQSVLWAVLFICLQSDQSPNLTAGVRIASRIAAAGGVMLALAGAVVFARIPWAQEPRHQPTLPAVIEDLANAPYRYCPNYYDALDSGELDYQVFATGIFLNHGALHTNPE